MKNTHRTKIHLRDGESTLASWTQNLERLPFLGEHLEIDSTRKDLLADYRSTALVFEIESHSASNSPTVILQARIRHRAEARTVIVLNRNSIPRVFTQSVEESLRSLLPTPFFLWDQGAEKDAICEIYSPLHFSNRKLKKLEKNIQKTLRQPISCPAAELDYSIAAKACH